MTVMSEGLLLNSKYTKMGREKGGFQALLTQLPLKIVFHELIVVYMAPLGPDQSECSKKLSRPIRIEHLTHVTYVTSQMPIYGHDCPRDPME